MANKNAKSRQSQSNIDDTQREVERKINPKQFNPQIQNIKRIITKQSLKNGLIIRRW